jgi:hypothetical protein
MTKCLVTALACIGTLAARIVLMATNGSMSREATRDANGQEQRRTLLAMRRDDPAAMLAEFVSMVGNCSACCDPCAWAGETISAWPAASDLTRRPS